jgi:hypothetical protein
VSSLTAHPRNPRKGDVELIQESLQRFGQQRPVLVDTQDRIVAGNHTVEAATALGWTHVAVIVTDLTDEQEIARYLVADNRTGDLATYDTAELEGMLNDLNRLDGTGYTPHDVAFMRAMREMPDAATPDGTEMYRMVLRYERETYEAMTEKLDALAEEWQLDSYSAVVERVMTDAAR